MYANSQAADATGDATPSIVKQAIAREDVRRNVYLVMASREVPLVRKGRCDCQLLEPVTRSHANLKSEPVDQDDGEMSHF